MAAPTPTTRVTPAGINLPDGYQTLITFARDTNVSLWEKSVTPPGVDVGDPVDTTTMHNSIWRTKSIRKLQDLTEATFTAAYDPDIYNQILALCRLPDTITVTFPDGSTLAFYGSLRSFIPDGLSEGEFPEATVTITPTNFDHVNKVVAGPVLTSVSGT